MSLYIFTFCQHCTEIYWVTITNSLMIAQSSPLSRISLFCDYISVSVRNSMETTGLNSAVKLLSSFCVTLRIAKSKRGRGNLDDGRDCGKGEQSPRSIWNTWKESQFGRALANLPAQVRRGWGATSFVTTRAPRPHASEHFSLQSFPHFWPLFGDELKVAESLELFPFHPIVGILIRRLHQRQQNHPTMQGHMFWRIEYPTNINYLTLEKFPKLESVAVWEMQPLSVAHPASPTFSQDDAQNGDVDDGGDNLPTRCPTSTALLGPTTKKCKSWIQGSWNSARLTRISPSLWISQF